MKQEIGLTTVEPGAADENAIPSQFLLSTYHYDLPPRLIAQQPAQERDSARLLKLERNSNRVTHYW
ncbi:MAG: S-adenosylmethionine:tRNA ribosyltransferase-isomerase, partial [Deltaproteobacteria bacterium]|nr:S-adenosylmethionine:tRNA ribosyltransferase-isomerase [Deltaproteobacteria bacterium]